MAMFIVDALEPVDVDEQHRQWHGDEARMHEFARQHLVERAAVHAAGQRIVFRGAPQLDGGMRLVRVHDGQPGQFHAGIEIDRIECVTVRVSKHQRGPRRRDHRHWHQCMPRRPRIVGDARPLQAQLYRLAVCPCARTTPRAVSTAWQSTVALRPPAPTAGRGPGSPGPTPPPARRAAWF